MSCVCTFNSMPRIVQYVDSRFQSYRSREKSDVSACADKDVRHASGKECCAETAREELAGAMANGC